MPDVSRFKALADDQAHKADWTTKSARTLPVRLLQEDGFFADIAVPIKEVSNGNRIPARLFLNFVATTKPFDTTFGDIRPHGKAPACGWKSPLTI